MHAHQYDTYAHQCTLLTHQNPKPAPRTLTIGIDEVGRGSLFGQMTVGAVVMGDDLTGEFGTLDLSNTPFAPLNDSKKLTAKKRETLSEHIKTHCHDYVLIDVPAFVIDTIDIYQATLLGMRLSIEYFIEKYPNTPMQIVIDGNAKPLLSDKYAHHQHTISTIIKGDGIHSSIACASIIAKVHRDNCMNAFAKQYPNYGLDKHKGYASKAHTNAIYEHGILPEHRKSFNPMRTMLANQMLF